MKVDLNFKASFRNRKFKYGGYAALITAFVLVILIVANLLVSQIPLKLDMTQNKLYSLSDQTIKALKDLKKDITIYALYATGNENEIVNQFLKKYEDSSKRISIKYIDPYKNPGLVKQYDKSGAGIDEGSLIVVSGSKFRVIGKYDMIEYNVDNTTGQTNVTGLKLEQLLTPAILYVTSDTNPVLYELQGHGEDTIIKLGVSSDFESANFEIKDLNLLTSGKVPDDATAVVVISPKNDLTDKETTILKNYFSKGGRALFLMDVVSNKLNNFNKIFESFGINLAQGVVMEGDNNNNAGNPIWILPKLESHEIVDPISSSNMYVLFPGSQAITEAKLKKRTLTIENLLTTTNNSWLRTNLKDNSLTKGKDDKSGPFALAVAVTDKAQGLNNMLKPKDAKIVVMASAVFLNEQYSKQVPGNLNLVVNSLNWLQEKKTDIQIASKDLTIERLNISTTQSLIVSGIAVIVIPVIIFLAGLSVWLRRRHL
ncbi:GldG family protein [Caldicellulosiruptoraceae bacterium PP1]